MKKAHKRIVWFLLVLIFIIFIVLFKKINNKLNDVPKITIGIQNSPAMALVMVAQEKEFFKKEGINVELKEFSAGKDALAAFIGGSLDFSISADVPALLATLQGNSFVVVAQVVKKTINEVRVVARKDSNFNTASSYFKAKKRKLATSFGAGPEFFTYEFLNKNNITTDEIEVIAQKPGDMLAALVSKSVDAISIYDPFAYFAEKQLGVDSITFLEPSVYSEIYIIEAKSSVKEDPVVLLKILRSLIEAEVFIKENEEESKLIVMNYTKLNKDTVDHIWDNFDFSVSLTPLLINNWERQVDWAFKTNKAREGSLVPDFRDMIFKTPLQTISPLSVSI